MRKVSSYKVTIKRKMQQVVSVLLTILIICFFLRTDFGSSILSSLTGWDQELIKDVTLDIMTFAGGFLLVSLGVAMAATVPFWGAGLAIIGAAILTIEAISIMNRFVLDENNQFKLW